MVTRSSSVVRDLALSAALFGLIAAGASWLGVELDRQATEVFDLGIWHVGDELTSRIEGEKGRHLDMLEFLATETLPRVFDDTMGFAEVSRAVVSFARAGGTTLEMLPGFQAINWVTTEGRIDLVYPQEGNLQAVGKDLTANSDPGVRAAIARALATTGPELAEIHESPLIELYQGGLGFAAYRATFDRGGRMLGVTNAAFRLADLVEVSLRREAPDERTVFCIWGPEGELLFPARPFAGEGGAARASLHSLEVLEAPWTLEVRPSEAWLREGLVLRGRMVQAVGLVLGLGIAGLAWGLSTRRRRQLESDRRLQLALDGASLGVWDLEVQTGRLYLNDQWVAMLGHDDEQVGGDLTWYRSLVHPEDLLRMDEAMRAHLDGGSDDYRSEHRLRSAEGDWVWVLDQGRVVERDPGGRPLRMAGTQNDITDERRAELELERSVARYRSIFEHSPIGLLEQDMSAAKAKLDELRAAGVEDLAAWFAEHPEEIAAFEGLPVTLDINPAFLELFGARTIEQYRDNVLRMVDERARRAYEQELVALHAGARTVEVDFPLRSLEGEELLYTVRLTVAPDCHDDLSSVFVSLVDNTRILREEEERRRGEARERELAKEESLALLAGGVAHDFNNLLVPIIGNIELAMQDLPHRSRAGESLLLAEQAAQRAAELARQMLTYSGRGQVKNHGFDMNALVVEMSALLSSSLPGKVDLATDFHDGPLHVEGDPTQLRQLVMNLVINAADAMAGEAGEVVVTTGRGRPTAPELDEAFLGEELADEPCAYLEVRDGGRGIDAETRKRIFEPFFSTKSTGRGLGMSVVLGIVRGHGGALVVHSTPGEGTRIRAWLPSSDAPAAAPERTARTGSLRLLRDELGGRVLLADDEAPVRGFTARTLESVGLEVIAVEDGVEALEAFRSCLEEDAGLDLVILDATMPRMGGVEAMEEIRALAPGFPVVLASGYTLEGVATRAAEADACWFLPKPYGVAELVRMVRTVLGDVDPAGAEGSPGAPAPGPATDPLPGADA